VGGADGAVVQNGTFKLVSCDPHRPRHPHLPVGLISVVSENPLIIFLPFKRTIFSKNGKACVRA
jgi:hypothetical protein